MSRESERLRRIEIEQSGAMFEANMYSRERNMAAATFALGALGEVALGAIYGHDMKDPLLIDWGLNGLVAASLFHAVHMQAKIRGALNRVRRISDTARILTVEPSLMVSKGTDPLQIPIPITPEEALDQFDSKAPRIWPEA